MIFKLWVTGGGNDWCVMVREVIEFVNDICTGLCMRSPGFQFTATAYCDVQLIQVSIRSA